MRKKIVAGNWKMNGLAETVQELSNAVADIQARCEIVVFPPFVYLLTVIDMLRNTPVRVGAQNCATALLGAYTGEVSAPMLKDISCRYVLVGHSERRSLYGETDAIVAEKFMMVQQVGLTPMLCVGETRAEREAGKTFAVIQAQLDAVLQTAGVSAFARAVIAYEPVWAIGTGLTATPEQAQEVHAKIREHIGAIDGKIADSLPILYGGSVKADNATALFTMPDIDGGLVGGASLDAAAFAKICHAA